MEQLLINDIKPDEMSFIQAFTVVKELTPIIKNKFINGEDFHIELFLLLEIIDGQDIPQIIDSFPSAFIAGKS